MYQIFMEVLEFRKKINMIHFKLEFHCQLLGIKGIFTIESHVMINPSDFICISNCFKYVFTKILKKFTIQNPN